MGIWRKEVKPPRRLVVHRLPPGSPNALSLWHRTRNPLRIALQFIIVQLCRILPSLALNRVLLRLIGVNVGRNVSISAMATIDFFFPDYITLEDNCIIGYDATILAHEYLQREWRVGRTVIGRNTLIGAHSVVLAGVRVGEDSTVSALSLVDKSVPPHSFAQGNPIRILRKRRK